jgi:hypothetical protein
MCPEKVYVIDGPKQTATPKTVARTAGKRPARAPSSETGNPARSNRHGWLLALRAYVLGPASLVFWPRGRGRAAWAIVGAGSVLATALLWIRWSTYFRVFEQFDGGAVFWVTSVALVILLTATAWARAVARSEPSARWPRAVRRTGAVCALGLVFPGLGLLIAGHRRKAAAAVWSAGLLIAAIVVTKHWRWLVETGLGRQDLTYQTIEGVLCVAAGCLVIGFFAWLAFALDGVRAVSPVARSSSVANRLALVLLVTLAAFLSTFRPASIARDLSSTAEHVRHQGLRIIPLALYDFASTLDPGTPTYLAEAAILSDELGMTGRAEAKRYLLGKRAAEFAGAVGAELVPNQD